MKSIAAYFDGIFDRIFSVLGAVGLAQFPQYFQQYLQRLGGHADEAKIVAWLFRDAARDAGYTIEDYITRFKNEPVPEIARQGDIMQFSIDRADQLAAAVDALQSANMFTRPFVFLAHMDTDIAMSALRIFQPGIPTTPEGAVYAFAGILLGLAFYHGVKWPVKKMAAKKKKVNLS